jgi:hypothetical protein
MYTTGGTAKKSALNTGARRKVLGSVSFGSVEENGESEDKAAEFKKKTKKVNKAAPVIQHPKTMGRMQDFKAELDRRIREQQAIDAQAVKTEESPGWLGGGSNQMFDAFKVIGSELQPAQDSPLGSLGKAFADSFSNISSLLGPSSAEQAPNRSESPIHTPALPAQTFSRRL